MKQGKTGDRHEHLAQAQAEVLERRGIAAHGQPPELDPEDVNEHDPEPEDGNGDPQVGAGVITESSSFPRRTAVMIPAGIPISRAITKLISAQEKADGRALSNESIHLLLVPEGHVPKSPCATLPRPMAVLQDQGLIKPHLLRSRWISSCVGLRADEAENGIPRHKLDQGEGDDAHDEDVRRPSPSGGEE